MSSQQLNEFSKLTRMRDQTRGTQQTEADLLTVTKYAEWLTVWSAIS